MPVLTQLNLNVGTEQNPNMVLHDLHDIRISSTDVNTVTRLLGCDAGVNSIAPLTLASAASLLGGYTLYLFADEADFISKSAKEKATGGYANNLGYFVSFKVSNDRMLQFKLIGRVISFRLQIGTTTAAEWIPLNE